MIERRGDGPFPLLLDFFSGPQRIDPPMPRRRSDPAGCGIIPGMSESPPRFTVIGWATQSYRHLAEGLLDDCRRFGYPHHLYEVDEEYRTLMKAWCNHPLIIRRGVEEFGSVLFLDVECRIVRPIPDHWRAPLVSVRRPAPKFWIRYNTGTVMADRGCLPWIDSWLRVIEAWQLGDLDADDYVHWPGDLCDELGLAAALAALAVEVRTPGLEYVDRSSDAEIARGLWKNRHTIIQHPTVHHWPSVEDPVESKKLFVQNYPGEPEEAARIFSSEQGRVDREGWAFDTAVGTYAPREFWPEHPRPWLDRAVILTSAQR